jgi:hypothetical protein
MNSHVIFHALQVFDVAHLPPKGFLDALLPIISEQAQKGDQVAAAVKDRLRILVSSSYLV